jgi:hypothetical protein
MGAHEKRRRNVRMKNSKKYYSVLDLELTLVFRRKKEQLLADSETRLMLGREILVICNSCVFPHSRLSFVI